MILGDGYELFRLERLEGEIGETRKTVQQLSNELGASDAREKAAVQDIDRLTHEQRVLQDKLDELESTLSTARSEVESRAEK